ncbi:MAG: patatin-like phospholipase family protein, partial [Pyrinomonadaceae bacterium]
MSDLTNVPPSSFPSVYMEEQSEITIRRRRQFYADDKSTTHDCVGLALSGGGIRSATFCLGFLQELNRLKLLRIFDYLSTVSGGGYVGGWWSAWLSRDEKVVRRKGNPQLDRSNIHNDASLVARIADGEDQVCKILREQIRRRDTDTYRLLTKYTEGECPKNELLNKLVDQLNAFIKTNDYPEAHADADLLASVLDPEAQAKLTEAEKAEVEKARSRQNDRRWENRFELEDAFPYELRNNFPPDEMIEPVRRSNDDKVENAEGSVHAYKDPIHHLRLFANYLTPRKGMLSADTWRAVSVIARNLILTWLILLPLLITVMLLGQAYFLLGHPLAEMFSPKYHDLILTLAPLVLLVSWSVVIAIGWLICNRETTSGNDWLVQIICLGALLLLLVFGLFSIKSVGDWIRALDNSAWILLGVWAAVTLIMVAFVWFWGFNQKEAGLDDPETLRWKKDVRRSRFTRVQAKILVTTAVVGVVLLVSWICTQQLPSKLVGFENISITVLSFISIVGSIAGSVFTALRAKPTTGGDRSALREPSFISRMIFAATPPLVLVVLATSAGVVANRLLRALAPVVPRADVTGVPSLLNVAALLFIALLIALAVYEMKDVKWSKLLEPSLPALLFIGMTMVTGSWFILALMTAVSGSVLFWVSTAIAVVVTSLILTRVIPAGGWKGIVINQLKNAGGKLTGVHQARTLAIVERTFGLLLIGSLTVIGWSIGSAIFKTTSTAATPAAQVIRSIVLSLVCIAGGAMLYRLFLIRQPSKAGPTLNIRWLSSRTFMKRPEARWTLAALCLIVPLGFTCLTHVLSATEHEGWGQFKILLFPFVLAALLGVLIFLRFLVIEKLAESGNPPEGRLIGILDWAFSKDLKKYDRPALRFLAGLAIAISLLVEPVARNVSSVTMAGRTRFTLLGLTLAISWLIFGSAIFQLRPAEGLKLRRTFQRSNLLYSKGSLWALALISVLLAQIAGLLLRNWLHQISKVPLGEGLTPILFPGAAFCFLLVLFEVFWGEGDNRRSIWLITLAYLGIATVFFLGLIQNPAVYNWKVVLGLLAAVIVWVVALGWMVDPNAVSMHQFYKGRLVRAYLGASNVRRRKASRTEITETVAGDDLLLSSLHNCERGGPYHLINTTLNLVGGRDLATAQRSASSFTLSQKYCGSSRTDYRPTLEYMSGQLSLGTAIAASGAAVSPNMGSKKPTAALAMLMTLLNVRLGYWAPTPNRETWNSSQPRLWPFYLLREFFSQTNDVSTYCYLTDGGHFDNTGLYSLIERGCRYIVLVDCGADPKPACFQDLGEAIRRCRIDFGTEIDLSLDPLLGQTMDSDRCFVLGRIRFSPKHLEVLG